MYTFLLIIHIFVCFFLVAVILLQAGKGGGMAETLGGNITQSILGTRSTAFMTKLTAVCATLFLITCVSLTYLSAQKRASVFKGYQPPPPVAATPSPVQPPTPPAALETAQPIASSSPVSTPVPEETPAGTPQ